jgi:hypothetical protein
MLLCVCGTKATENVKKGGKCKWKNASHGQNVQPVGEAASILTSAALAMVQAKSLPTMMMAMKLL